MYLLTAMGVFSGWKVVTYFKGSDMSLGTILLIVLILILIGVLPTWPHSRAWGYAPSGGLGVLLVVVLILWLLGRI